MLAWEFSIDNFHGHHLIFATQQCLKSYTEIIKKYFCQESHLIYPYPSIAGMIRKSFEFSSKIGKNYMLTIPNVFKSTKES